MDIEQKTDLTYIRVEEIDKKINKVISDVNNLSPFSDDSNNSEKITTLVSDTTTIKTQNTNIKTDTEKISADTTKLKSDLEDLTTWTENNNVTAVKEKVDDISTKVDYIKNKDNEIKSATENIKIDTEGIMTRCDGQSAKLDQILLNQQNTPQIDPTSITSTIVGESEVNLTNLNSKIETTKSDIKGSDDIDLTEINNKLNSLSTYFEDNPLNIDFVDDPFKLDEDFTGYTKKAHIYNTTDSIESTKQYTVNLLGKNSNYYLFQVGVYCEDETFDIKFTCDLEVVSENTKIEYNFLDANIGQTNKTSITETLTMGRNIFSKTIEDINVLEDGNFVFIRLPNGQGTIVHSYKLEVFGSNISILTKPRKFRIYCKHGETIISKIENQNGYYLTCPTDELSANVVNMKYKLDQENVRDYIRAVTSLANTSTKVSAKGVPMKTYVDLDGHFFQQISNAPKFIFYSDRGELIDSMEHLGNNCHALSCGMTYYSSVTLFRTVCYLDKANNSISIAAANAVIANFSFVKFLYKSDLRTDYNEFSFVITKRNGDNILYEKFNSNSLKINIGYGENVTAYYDKDNDNKIYVYMKVKDKMVKKTIVKNETTDEDGVTTNTFEITEQKVIGTYDIYYETTNDKYFVVKDNQLYIFKK